MTPGLPLAAFANDKRDRVDVDDRAPPYYAHTQLRVGTNFLGLAFKLIEEVEKTWRRNNGPEQITLLLEGIVFKDGEPVRDDQRGQQKLAA